MNRKKAPISVQGMVHQALSASWYSSRVRRLIPAACPVLEVEHTLEVQVDESLGVVERYMMEALAKFGPMAPAQISDFMGIDRQAVETVIGQLWRFSNAVRSKGGKYSVSPDAPERLKSGRWSDLVERRHSFLVNGVSGKLLSINFSELHDRNWLRPNPGSSHLFRDYSGSGLDNLCWMAPSYVDGFSSLRDWIGSGESEERSNVGIPEGCRAVIPGKSSSKRMRWLIVLIVVFEDGKVLVQPFGNSDLRLFEIRAEESDAFSRILRRGDEMAPQLLKPKISKRVENEISKDWSEHISYVASGGDMVVKLLKPDAMPLWMKKDGSADFPERLRNILLCDYKWNPYTYTVRRYIPGDQGSAIRMVLMRGMSELNRVAGRAETEEFSLEQWWYEFQEKVASDWPAEIGDTRISYKAMLAEARKSPDGAVVELVAEYL